MTEENNGGRKILWILLGVGLLAIFTIFIVSFVSSRERAHMAMESKITETKPGEKALAQNEVTEVKESTTPDFFPKDLPIEANAKIVKNFNTTATDGRMLGTRVYVTAKTVDENYKIFENYFKQAGYNVTAAPEIKGSTSKTLLATKDTMQAQVTIGDDAVAKAKTVAIIFTQYPKK